MKKKPITNEFVASAYEYAGFKELAGKIRNANGMNELSKIAISVIKKIADTNGTFKQGVHDATSDSDKDERTD